MIFFIWVIILQEILNSLKLVVFSQETIVRMIGENDIKYEMSKTGLKS